MAAPLFIGAAIGALGGLAGGFLGARDERRARRRQRRAIARAQQIAEQRSKELTADDTIYGKLRAFTGGIYGQEGYDNPLVQDFAKGIRASQASRGVFTGNAAAAAEAQGSSAFLQQLRQSMVGQAMDIADAPERLRQAILASEMPVQIAAAGRPTSMANIFNSVFQGAMGGANVGLGFGGLMQSTRQNDLMEQDIGMRQEAYNRMFGDGGNSPAAMGSTMWGQNFFNSLAGQSMPQADNFLGAFGRATSGLATQRSYLQRVGSPTAALSAGGGSFFQAGQNRDIASLFGLGSLGATAAGGLGQAGAYGGLQGFSPLMQQFSDNQTSRYMV